MATKEEIMHLADDFAFAYGRQACEAMRWDSSRRYVAELENEKAEARQALSDAIDVALAQARRDGNSSPAPDVITINGKRYSTVLFGPEGFCAPAGTLLRIEDGPDDVVTCTVVKEEA